jgi:hypothetical protein
MSELETLKLQLKSKEAELLQAKLKLIEIRIADLQRSEADKELRLRAVEASRTRFETLAWLAFGSGTASLVNILLNLK